jgi:hypothetical protein
MDDSIKRVSFQHVMDKVVGSVKENNPDWFEMHKEVFFEMADYMFELTYDMNTFSKLFYEALGFMGRNFRFRDDEKFLPLEYRYRTVGYTDLRAIFDQLDKAHAAADEDETVLRLSMDAKATIPIGLFSRNMRS